MAWMAQAEGVGLRRMSSWTGVQVHVLGNLFGFGPLNLYQWAIPFSVICALGVINAINMIDGLDGTAGGVSIVALLSLAYAALVQGLGVHTVLLLLLAAAVTGFLMWNMRFPGIRTQARVDRKSTRLNSSHVSEP